jgi:cell division protein FtsQ
MWDNAPLLRSIANALIASSVLAVLYGAAHYAVHRPGLFPLHTAHLSAAPQRVDAAEVLQVLRNETGGNLFTVDIDRLRQALEKLPWVRKVSIRREFPDGLLLQFEEHQAVARWNNVALVNRQGEVFAAASEQKLPVFIGQDGTAAEIAQQYVQFSQQLAGLDLQVTRLELSPRHAWQLHLSNGMVLELGREDMQQRLARFVTVYPYSLAAEQGRVKYVDLRYRNGFAVRVTGGSAKQG